MLGDGVVSSDEVRDKDRESNNHLITAEWITNAFTGFMEYFQMSQSQSSLFGFNQFSNCL